KGQRGDFFAASTLRGATSISNSILIRSFPYGRFPISETRQSDGCCQGLSDSRRGPQCKRSRRGIRIFHAADTERRRTNSLERPHKHGIDTHGSKQSGELDSRRWLWFGRRQRFIAFQWRKCYQQHAERREPTARQNLWRPEFLGR